MPIQTTTADAVKAHVARVVGETVQPVRAAQSPTDAKPVDAMTDAEAVEAFQVLDEQIGNVPRSRVSPEALARYNALSERASRAEVPGPGVQKRIETLTATEVVQAREYLEDKGALTAEEEDCLSALVAKETGEYLTATERTMLVYVP